MCFVRCIGVLHARYPQLLFCQDRQYSHQEQDMCAVYSYNLTDLFMYMMHAFGLCTEGVETEFVNMDINCGPDPYKHKNLSYPSPQPPW